MAAVVIEGPPGLQPLFKNISLMFNRREKEDVVQSLKRNYGGKFNSLDNHDLPSSFQLLEKHGHVSDNKLTLIKDYIAPKSNKEELIKQFIESYKASLKAEVEPKKELQGRLEEIKEITRELETGKSSVVNLFGSAGVGKTTLANEVCSTWRGKHFVFDLREAKDMRAIYLNMMSKLKLTVPMGVELHQKYAVARIHAEIQSFESDGQSVLFLLDNVEQFTAGQGKEGKNLKIAFVQFLESLVNFDGKEKKTLKLLLTSRTQLQDTKEVNNFEVKSLDSSFSEKILVSKVMASVNTDQKNKLIGISKGIPLLLKGLAAILRQERKSADDLIAEVHKEQKSKSEEDAKEKPTNFEEEGVDMGQLSAIREMFNTLPNENLKVSAVSISLFCGPFSASTAGKILGISVPEALAQLEGLVTSAIIFVVDEEAKERKYDIHPLLRKYANSIKDDAIFQRAYLEAKGRFHQHFMSKMEKIAKLIEPDYVRAFRLFESDRPNYEFTVDISLQPEYFSVPGEFHENALIASLFNAMLAEDKQIKLFHSWAEMCEDDGHTGSLCRAQLKCWEARQVLDFEGTEKTFKILEDASRSLENVQDKSSESYTLSKGLYLHHEGEAYWFNRDYKKALESLESSLKSTEQLLKVHTDVARCYNAIGNCQYALDKPMEALDFYKIAYHMQEELAGGEYHFDMPMYKNQIGTVYESQGDYDKAVEYYKEALKLLDELKLSGFHDEAFFCRNLANALMFQKKHREAVEPADRAYNIRMKILGNHPLTVRSIFQRAVIQANFRDYEEALKLFLEAWEMEKSLAAGNHSEVWRKIITGVEDMYVFLAKGIKQVEKVLPPALSKKGKFKEDALKFCQRFWKEQKEGQFGFTNFNKEIIDAIIYLAGNKKDKYEAEKDALWFYDGMQSATEGEFQEEFDQETDSSLLNEILKERVEFLDKVIELCHQVADHEKLTKHRNIKLALFKKVLLRPDFVGEKEDGYDKATLKGKVEQLYRDLGQKEQIPEFREKLLRVWQKQWEEGKDGEKTKKIGVARERMIDGILQLCKELKKSKMFRREAQKEALWFYDGMLNATEEELQEEFDKETDNNRLNEMLKEREKLFDKGIKLCREVSDHEKLTKQRNIKLALYKKVLVRPDFVGEKEYEKATLKGTVEQLYEILGQKEKIPEFRENLLRVWQKQWEEGKDEGKTKKIGVARERMINGILQLCKELKSEMLGRYRREGLSFYEDKWEEMYAELKPDGMEKLLLKCKELASSIGDRERKKTYNEALRDLKRTKKPPGPTLRPKAKQPASESQEEEEEEEEIVGESEEEITVGSEEEEEEEEKEEVEELQQVDVGAEQEIEVVSMEAIVVASEEGVTEVGPDAGEVEDKSFIYEETVTNKGSHWELTKVAAHVIFPPDAVSEDRLMTLHRWKPSVCSPPLQENEAIVSDVVELSTEMSEGFVFNKEVTLAISHSAADLKGYEVVVKQLTDRDSNEWVDVDETVDIRSLSDLEKAYGSDFPDYLLPVAETQITQCSTYVVVCRLKSHVFTITSEPVTLSLPNYPLVTIVIPQNAVPATETFHVTVKVQEFPCEEIKNKEMLAGPILRISCDREIEFQEPVTVQLPKSLREKPDVDVPDLSLVRARVLFQQSDGEQREWTEITDRRELHPSFDGTVTTFSVRHFSGFWSWLEWCATPVVQMVARMQADQSGARQGEGEQEGGRGEGGGAAATAAAAAAAVETSRDEMRTSSQLIQIAGDYNTECVRQAAVFTACLPSDARLGYNTKLSLYCSPNDKRRELIDKEDDILLEEESAWEIMKPNDKAYVFLSGDVIRPVKEQHLKDLFVRFQEHHSMKRSLKVQVVTTGDLTIEFCSSRELEEECLLCRLEMELPPPSRDVEKNPVEFFGVPLNDSVLTDAPLMGILGACKGVLEEIKRREIYDKHSKRSEDERAAVTSFFTSLARLSPDDQQECFAAIVSFLEKPGDGQEGMEHVAYRLRYAEKRVTQPPHESLRDVVAEKLGVGRLWRKLARGLKIKEAILDAIEEEERGNGQDCCCAALKRWYESNGSCATTREIMICLTNMGYGSINWHIMKELKLVAEADMPQTERS